MLAPRGGHSPTHEQDPEAGPHIHFASPPSSSGGGGRVRLESRDPQAKHGRRWTSSIKVFMFHRCRLVLLVLLVLAVGGSAVLGTARLHKHEDDNGGVATLAAEGSMDPGLTAEQRPRRGERRAEMARQAVRKKLLEEEEEEDDGDDEEGDMDDGPLDFAAALAKAAAADGDGDGGGEESGVRSGGAMEKMRKRKQALKRYAADAQKAADEVRQEAAKQGALPVPDLQKTEAPPVREPGRGFWWGEAMAATLAVMGHRTEAEERELTEARRKAVHEAVMHAWGGYKRFAWGKDELMPLTQTGQDWFGLGLTLVDTLDLLWLLGEKEEFMGAAAWVADELNVSKEVHVNVFECTIRVLGGLLSAYHLSGDPVFLEKAKELGQNLRPAMESPSGVPWSDAVLAKQSAFAPNGAPDSSVSEATSIQLEFKSLAQALGDEGLFRLAERSMRAVDRARSDLPPGELSALVPMFINARTGQFNQGSTITLGARGDSYYEYLLKQWLLTGKKDGFYRDLYTEAVAAIRSQLLRHSEPRGLAYIAELQGGSHRFAPKMDHLVCYLPGTLALGMYHGLDESHLTMAQDLMASCFAFYNSTATGLAPEIAYFAADAADAAKNPDFDLYIHRQDAHNILRPETVESLFYLWRVTKDPVYREWGWRIFEAFERHSKIESGGYSGISNVNSLDNPRTDRRDKMESFFLGETLKYFVLLFGEDELLDLDELVLNTEAHPLPVFEPHEEWVEHKPEHDTLPTPEPPEVVEEEGEEEEGEEGDWEEEVGEEMEQAAAGAGQTAQG